VVISVDVRLQLSDTLHPVGLLWVSDEFVAETSTWQHTTPTTEKPPCPRRDSKP